MPDRAAFRRPRREHPAARRRGLASAGVALPLAVAVAITGASAAPSTMAQLAAGDVALAGGLVDSTADGAGGATVGAEVGDVIMRSAPQRAARGAERARVAALAAESTRRADTEAALAANEQVKDIATVPPPPPAWQRPLDDGYTLTSGFSRRWGTMHPAQDFAIPEGTPVRSPSAGTVLVAGWEGSYGYKVEIQLWDGTIVWFAHNSALGVTPGQPVAAGQVVAASGNTGHSTGPHVHVEVHPGGGDPVPVMEWLAAHGIPM